jgi:hypothetical protein
MGRDPIRALRRLYTGSGIRERIPHELKVRARGPWVRLARRIGYPVHSPMLPAPARPRRGTELRLSHVLLACDLNPRYLEYWGLASRAWREIAGLEPVLVLVADAGDVPVDLRDDERVRVVDPVPGLHTAFQAQCIRLLYPALLDVRGAVLISDMEMLPMDARYFHRPLARLDRSFFVSYRDVLLPRGEMALCYNASTPATWGEIFRVGDEGDVTARLREWGADLVYEGSRGGSGWFTDQLLLHRELLPWGTRTGRLWLLDDQYTGFRRLDRIDIEPQGRLTPEIERDILTRAYTDFHCLVPPDRFRDLNDQVVELAIRAESRGNPVLARPVEAR